MKSITVKTLVVSVILVWFCNAQVAAQAPSKATDLIALKAQEFTLGSPRPESPAPRQTPPPRNHGWWQAFERGWVYWTPAHGAHVVRGRIFEVWGREGWEQGTLGFPTHDEEVCRAPDLRDNYQRFEGGVIYWRAATNQATIHYNDAQNNLTFAVSGVCTPTATAAPNTSTTSPLSTNRVENTSVPAQGPPSTSPPPDKKTDRVDRNSGVFRITIDNFIAVQVAHNGLLDAGDDAFLMWDAQEFNADGRLVGWPRAGRSLIYGDIGRNRAHIQAGTQGDNGGIRAGDKISGRSAPSANRLPMLVGDFLLVDGENAFVFAPTVWVAENEEGNLAYLYRRDFGLQARYATYEVREHLERPHFSRFRWTWGGSLGDDSWFHFRFPWGMNNTRGDRPMGALKVWIQQNNFKPDFYLLTYKTVTEFIESAGGRRQVPFETHYRDVGGGEYTIAMTIERVK